MKDNLLLYILLFCLINVSSSANASDKHQEAVRAQTGRTGFSEDKNAFTPLTKLNANDVLK